MYWELLKILLNIMIWIQKQIILDIQKKLKK